MELSTASFSFYISAPGKLLFMKLLKHITHLNRRERKGLLVLSSILIAVILLRLAVAKYYKPQYNHLNSTVDSVEFITLAPEQQDEDYISADYPKKSFKPRQKKRGNNITPDKLFTFNPNTISYDSLLKLGVSTKTASTFINFRNKGARFYKPEDMSKVYGITATDFEFLEPYISIPSSKPVKNDRKNDNATEKTASENKPKPAKPYVVHVNTADSSDLVKVKGIGPFYAGEIIDLRKEIGGILKPADLLHLYKMDSTRLAGLMEFLIIEPEESLKIPINEVNFVGLIKIPFLNKNQVNAILNYREMHGDFKTIDDLAEIKILTEPVINELTPRLDFTARELVQN